MTSVLTAVTHRAEADFVRVLEDARDLVLVRRCADLAELLSVGATGAARVAVVSPDLRGLDRDALRHLAGHGVRVAGLVLTGDDEGERRLRQLGVATILRLDTGPDEVSAALSGLAGSTTSGAGLAAAQAGSLTAGHQGTVRDGDHLARADGAPGASSGGSRGSMLPGDAEVDRPPGVVTVVWGPIGAPGRTTVATTLAAVLAGAGVRALLVDLDTWGASVAQVLGLVDEAPGVAAAARASEQGGLDVLALARLAPEVVPGLRVLTGLPRADRWPELRAAAVEDVLRLARRVADHVVVDVGFCLEDDEELSYDTLAPRRNAATLAALEGADQLVVVGAADPVGLQRLVRGVQEVAVVPSPQPTVVVNKVRPSVAGARPERAIREVLGRFAGMDGVRFLPWAPDECDAALLAGRTLPETAPSSPLTAGIVQLAAAVDPRASPAAPSRAGRRGHGRRGRARRGSPVAAAGRHGPGEPV
ncbi:CpaE family protein [Oryzobacter sp. R7]|uniref:AAA family ATPase n=1 Tax=Oryzobacter faecalis TaxID=3388656 RepID=UPI00398CED4B